MCSGAGLPAGTNSEVVAVYPTRPSAEIARGVLHADGIEARLLVDDSGGLAPSSALTEGVRLVVRSDRAAEARELLTSHRGGSRSADEVQSHTSTTRSIATGLAVLLIGMILYNVIQAIA